MFAENGWFALLPAVLWTALFWHGLNFAVILKNRKEFRRLNAPVDAAETAPVTISVLIPARNEAANLPALLHSLAAQTRPADEIIVCDDHSTDGTGDVVLSFQSRLTGLKVLTSAPKPEGWIGKNWACNQLAGAASGTHLLFVDADISFEPGALAAAARQAGAGTGLITVWPHQVMPGLTVAAALTTMYYTLLAFLPAAYMTRKPRWMPAFLYPRFRPLFTAACGQFMLFSRMAYRDSGGHQAVRSRVVEDVELARLTVAAGHEAAMCNGAGTVNCRMYRSNGEAFQGFRKNFFAGFGYRWLPFMMMAVLHAVVYFGPFAALFAGDPLLKFAGGAALLLALAGRAVLMHMIGWPLRWALLAWAGVLWFEVLGIVCLADRATGRKPAWKGRPVS